VVLVVLYVLITSLDVSECVCYGMKWKHFNDQSRPQSTDFLDLYSENDETCFLACLLVRYSPFFREKAHFVSLMWKIGSSSSIHHPPTPTHKQVASKQADMMVKG